MVERHTLTLPLGSITIDQVDGKVGMHITQAADDNYDSKLISFTLQPAHLAWLAAVAANLREQGCLDCSS